MIAWIRVNEIKIIKAKNSMKLKRAMTMGMVIIQKIEQVVTIAKAVA